MMTLIDWMIKSIMIIIVIYLSISHHINESIKLIYVFTIYVIK